MNKQYFILISFILLLSNFAVAQQKTPLKNSTVLKNKLVQQAKETSSITASFKQEKHVSFMKEPQLSEGKFYYQQHDKMRWEQESPYNYVLLINNGKVRIKDNGKEKDIKGANQMMGKINKLMLGLINGEVFDNKDFTPAYFSTKDTYIVELTPKNKRLQSIFNTIELSFSIKSNRLTKLIFYEKSGDKSVMNFFNDKFNTSIKPSIFNTL